MLSKRYSQLIRTFAIISLTYLVASCGDGEGPAPVPAVPCPGNGVVSFDADSYPINAESAMVTLTDTCIGFQTVDVLVDNGTESITVAVTLDSRGAADPVSIEFGPTDDSTDTIAIAEGDTLTATYIDANSVSQTDTASILEASLTLGVYSETNVDPVLNYSEITNAADLGGYVTATSDVATDIVAPLEGDVSLQAVFEIDNPVSGTYNGFAFSFVGSIGNGANDLTNFSFELPDASAGDEDCTLIADGGSSATGIPGWECFNGAFVASNLFKPGGPDDVQNPTAVDGTQLMKLFNKDGIARQVIPVTAGDNVHASVYGMNWTGDEFNNLFILQIAFYDELDPPRTLDPIGVEEITANTFDDGTLYQLEPKDGGKATDWTLMEVSAVAPAGALSARIVMLHILTDGTPNTGSLSIDAPRLYKGAYDPAPPLVDSGDISSYDKLTFGVNKTAATGLLELEVKMEDAAAGSASVFLSAYTPTITGDWAVYDIPLDDFGSVLDKTVITSLGFYNPSTVVNTDSAYPALFAATVYFDDVHFVKKDTGPVPLTGVLLDAAVEGVTYSTLTQSGITNVDGEFSYFAGEMVTFSVGGIVLGTVEGAAFITPVELTGGGNPVDQNATNQLVFLQSIDEDQDPSNGITISAATQSAAATQTLDFTLDSAAFTAAVTSVVTAITPAPGNAIVSETAALDNFYVTYTQVGGTDVFDWSFPPADYPAYPGTASFPVDFEDAGAPYFFSDFEGGVATVIANPQSTGNASAKVAQMQKFSGQTYGGSTLTLGEISYANGTVFTMNVWASRAVPVTLKLEGLDNVEQVVSHSGSSSWEQLVFVFDGINADTGAGVREITLIFDNGVNGDAAGNAADWTFYFDDINLVSTDPAEYTLIFSDEFDGSALDTNKWTIETGYGDNGWGNNEWQNYTPESIKVENGSLAITADCPVLPCGSRDGTVTSGRINTLGNFSFKYGIAEARIKAPDEKAAWPAFWMLGENFPTVGWPFTGEVDIMEIFAYQSDDKTTHAAMHWCDETVVGVTPTNCFPIGWQLETAERSFDEPLGDDYHVFSAEWNEDRIIAKIDGIEFFNKAIDPVTMDEFLKEFFLILNVAMGGTLGSGGQDPDGTEVWPQTMLVDYVRVYQLIPASAADSTISLGAASLVADGTTTTATVQAKDASGNNFTRGGDDVVLTASGDATISATNDEGDGTYTATISSLKAEQVIVSGTINGVAITGTAAVDRTIDFTPDAAFPADGTISSSTASLAAGSTATITVTVVDANGNLTAGVVGLSVDGSAMLGTTTNPSIGIYTATLDNTTAEDVTVSGTIDTVDIGDVAVSFIPGAASASNTTIVAVPSVVKNDNVAISTISVQAIDANGNNVTAGTDSVVLSSNDANSSATLTPASHIGNGVYEGTISNSEQEILTITGTINGVSITGSANPTVTFTGTAPSAPDSELTVGAATAVADGTTIALTVQVNDNTGAPLTGGGATVILTTTGSATMSGTGVVDNGGGSYTANDEGDGTYTAVISSTVAESVVVSATINGADVGVNNDQGIDFTPGPADIGMTTISLSPSSVFADDTETSTISVQTKDANGNDLATDTVAVVFTTNDANASATVSTASYTSSGVYEGTIQNSEVESLLVSALLNTAPITDDAAIDFTAPFSVDKTEMTVSFATAGLDIGTNTNTVSTITVQVIDDADAPLTSSPGVLTLMSDSIDAIIVQAPDADDGTYSATISNPAAAAQVVTITGDIDGRVLTDMAVVTFGRTIAISTETNADIPLEPSQPAYNDAACDQTVTLTDGVPTATYPSYEGVESSEAAGLPAVPVNDCVESVVNFGASPDNTIVSYIQDHEALDIDNTFALGLVGGELYRVFADVWNGDVGTGVFLYDYGPFTAPNGGAGFSAIATGEGGVEQGLQYLNIYSDYNNGDHNAVDGACAPSSCTINTSVFKEPTTSIDANDIGGVWTFSGDFKAPSSGGIAEPLSNATASAYIKTLDPGAGFATTNDIRFDSTDAQENTWNIFSIEISLSDPALAGQILQFGFGTVASNYEDSGVYYDNISFAPRSVDLSGYASLRFALDVSAAAGFADMELRMEDANGNTASVFLSNPAYAPVPANPPVAGADWQLYEIPVADFANMLGTFDNTNMKSLSFVDPSSTVSKPPGIVTPLVGTIRSDDLHFIEAP